MELNAERLRQRLAELEQVNGQLGRELSKLKLRSPRSVAKAAFEISAPRSDLEPSEIDDLRIEVARLHAEIESLQELNRRASLTLERRSVRAALAVSDRLGSLTINRRRTSNEEKGPR